MNRIFWTLLCVFFFAGLRAQVEDAAKIDRLDFVLSVHIAGDPSILSLSFEKLNYFKPGLILAGKLGLGYNQEFQLFDTDPPRNFFILPHAVSLNLGISGRSFVELGVGGSWIHSRLENYYLVYPMAGYRFLPFRKSKFSFKIWGFYPFGQIAVLDKTDMWVVPLGVSLGMAL